MARDLFRDRHPLLYHLKHHSRELLVLATMLFGVLWYCWGTFMVSKKIDSLSG